MTSLKTLENRAAAFNKSLSDIAARRRNRNCNCRKVTHYHNADELEAIVATTCPVHGVRDLGSIWWWPDWKPLDEEFRMFCHCPPNLRREFLEGKRPKPTPEEEWDEEMRRHNERELTVSPEERLREDRKDKEKYDRVYGQYRKKLDEQAELRRRADLAELRLRTQGR